MGTDRLREHYNRKHVLDLATETVDLVPLAVRRPATPCEAAVRSLAPRIPAGATVLEVGAGDGQLAESLRVGGVDFASYTLLELSDLRLEGLRRRLDHPVYRLLQGDVEQLAGSLDTTFDVVIMVELVEHLVDPLGALQDVRKLVRPGGFAYVDTPNIAKWTRRARLAVGRFPSTAGSNEGLSTYEGTAADLYDEGHLHYFTYRSLSLLLTERCGFNRVERLGYFCGPRRLPLWLGSPLAQRWPTMFGEVAVAAYVD